MAPRLPKPWPAMEVPTYGNKRRKPHRGGVPPIKYVERNFHKWLAHEPAFIKLHEDYARCEQQQQDDSTIVATCGNMAFCDAIQQAKVLAQCNPFYARHRSLVKDMDRIVAREKELKLQTLSQTSGHLSSCTAELNPQRIDGGNRRRRLGNPVSAFSGAISSCWIRRPAAAELPVIPKPALTKPVPVDTVHKETGDPTAATAQTSCVRSDLQQTRSGRWRLLAHWLQ